MENQADQVPITTDELLQCIGELYIQVRVIRRMLANRLEASDNSAIKEREIQSNN